MSILRPQPSRGNSTHYSQLPSESGDGGGGVLPATPSRRPSHMRHGSNAPLFAPARPVSMARTMSRMSVHMSEVGFGVPSADADKDEDGPGLGEGEPPLTAQERKMLLVAEALEETGMGRYQWCIFALCGLGYALDLAWAQTFGLIMPRVQIELGISDANYGDIFAVFSTGLTFGAFTWGILVDIIGRRWAFNLTVAITAFFGLMLGACDSYTTICALTFFVGFGLGGNIPIDATIVMEFLPSKNRYLLIALSIFQPIGTIVTSFLCWALIPKYACKVETACSAVAAGEPCCTKAENFGWRYTMFFVGGISVLAFLARFVLFNFRESPRFLITKGRDAEAVAVCHAVAATNGRACALTLAQLQELDDAADADDAGMSAEDAAARGAMAVVKDRLRALDLSHLRGLFASPRMARLTLLAWAVYMADHWGFTVSGAFLPKILAERGAEQDVSIDTTYRNYILISLAGMPGVLLGAMLVEVPLFGRKWSMVGTSALMAVSLVLYATATTFEDSVRLNMMEYFFQSAFNAVLYGWTPEAFPSAIRGSACGLASFWGRLTSIVAPLIAEQASTYGQLYMAAGGTLLCTLLAVFLPETRGAVSL